jgi:hypothetical protein
LAASKWRSRFGRPTKIDLKLGDVVGGSYCKMPEDWLQKKIGNEIFIYLIHRIIRLLFSTKHLNYPFWFLCCVS